MSPPSSSAPSPFLNLISNSTVIKQGAEAKVYKTTIFPSQPPVLIKHRFPKLYRHAHLDAQLTRARVTSEARCLVRAARGGVTVPGLRGVEVESGVVAMEWVEGWSVREVMGGGDEEDDVEGSEDGEVEGGEEEELVQNGWDGLDLALLPSLIGSQLALLHLTDIIHGDLTTSNMMIRPLEPSSPSSPSYELVMIDFGLSFSSTLAEDKAVDLYVLERAFSSTHPGSEGLFEEVMVAYEKKMGKKAWKEVGRRLEDVRLRGRKRSMLG
ncbi:kinase-like domain-containing protein [Mrakia frigida]|uniref:serine/threonine protein kinase BUD32 n=1 Tax=Mrakia frigida TaxID=29902 RepID=UPI003FCC072D